jgi:transposase
MTDNELFTRALNLGSGWEVYNITFSAEEKELKIFIRTLRGSVHSCGTCGEANCRIYDHGKEREWRHMNFFQFQAVIIGKPPRVECPKCGAAKTASLSWARERSGFSLYFEAFMVLLAKSMSMNETSRLLGEHDTTLWPILQHYVDEAREEQTLDEVTRIAIDETSRAK